MKKRNVALVLAATMMLSLAGCAGSNEKTEDTKKAQTEAENKTDEKEDAVQIDGALSIYCGAGMQQPFQEIADAFQEETGCEMNVTYANAAQIQTQIQESQEGDFFIAGSKEELKPVEEFVTSSEDLVKHIPVLVVKEGNENSDKIKALVDVLKSDEIKDFINEKYDGAVIPFEDSDDAETEDAEAADDADETAAAEADTADETAEETDAE